MGQQSSAGPLRLREADWFEHKILRDFIKYTTVNVQVNKMTLLFQGSVGGIDWAAVFSSCEGENFRRIVIICLM